MRVWPSNVGQRMILTRHQVATSLQLLFFCCGTARANEKFFGFNFDPWRVLILLGVSDQQRAIAAAGNSLGKQYTELVKRIRSGNECYGLLEDILIQRPRGLVA
jgi:hypothetical protein